MMSLIFLGLHFIIVVLFVWSDNQLRSQLSAKRVSGKIVDIKIGSKGGSAGASIAVEALTTIFRSRIIRFDDA